MRTWKTFVLFGEVKYVSHMYDMCVLKVCVLFETDGNYTSRFFEVDT